MKRRTSRFIGVFKRSDGRWIAKVKYKGKTYMYRTCKSEFDAARIYDEEVLRRGLFRYLRCNFITRRD